MWNTLQKKKKLVHFRHILNVMNVGRSNFFWETLYTAESFLCNITQWAVLWIDIYIWSRRIVISTVTIWRKGNCTVFDSDPSLAKTHSYSLARPREMIICQLAWHFMKSGDAANPKLIHYQSCDLPWKCHLVWSS